MKGQSTKGCTEFAKWIVGSGKLEVEVESAIVNMEQSLTGNQYHRWDRSVCKAAIVIWNCPYEMDSTTPEENM